MAAPKRDRAQLYAFDEALRGEHPLLCGVDEAGRGPLCGPVGVAAVVLDAARPIEGIDDSKKLGEAKREALYETITAQTLAYSVVLVPPAEIDRMNISQATLWGMRQAVEGLGLVPNLVLVDGNRLPQLSLPMRAVVKGDATSASIAAASILAKVARDRHMRALDKQYPQYRLAKHKGYGTKEHYALLLEHGIQDFYRQSFLKSFYAMRDGENV